MSSKMPPVPPAERSNKGHGSDPRQSQDSAPHGKQAPTNVNEQGETANIRQNTSNQGYQQKR